MFPRRSVSSTQLADLEPDTRDRILKKLAEAQEWTDHRVEPLSGWDYYKLQTGDYRAILTWDKDKDVLIMEAVGHR